MFVNKEKINKSRFFPMLHHKESQEKPQYNMAVPPFLDKPSQFVLPSHFFSSKTSQIPPFLSILNKSNIPFMKGGGGGGGMVGGSNYD